MSSENMLKLTPSQFIRYTAKITSLISSLANKVGNLESLNTTNKTDLVSAVNEVRFDLDGLGEPFRLVDFSQTFNVTIPSVTTSVNNTSIPNIDIDLDVIDPTGKLNKNFAIAGIVKYEVFDSATGGSRINVMPICYFSMNTQRVLRIRMMAAGPNSVNARRIVGAILLKHR